MKKTIIFFLGILLLTATAAAIYQEPLMFDAPPSKKILIKTVTTTDGVTRQFATGEAVSSLQRMSAARQTRSTMTTTASRLQTRTISRPQNRSSMTTLAVVGDMTTGETIINVPRKPWSSAGTDETPDNTRYAIPYQRRQKFQASMEYGTQAHTASITSQADITKWSMFRRAGAPAEFKTKIDRSGEKRKITPSYARTPTGQTVLPGQTTEAKPAFEGQYPPLMPGEKRPYEPETSGLTRDYLYAEEQVQISERPGKWIQTGATITNYPKPEQSPKGPSPYLIGGAGQMGTAGQAYSKGETPLTERENPYALGGAGQTGVAGQAGDIEAVIKARQEQAMQLLTKMGYR